LFIDTVLVRQSRPAAILKGLAGLRTRACRDPVWPKALGPNRTYVAASLNPWLGSTATGAATPTLSALQEVAGDPREDARSRQLQSVAFQMPRRCGQELPDRYFKLSPDQLLAISFGETQLKNTGNPFAGRTGGWRS
jgi:hypothetical protein